MIEGLFQPTHLILILVIVLIVFGPGKLPEIGSALGKSIREFRSSTRDDLPPGEEKTTATTTTTTTATPTATRSTTVKEETTVAGSAPNQQT